MLQLLQQQLMVNCVECLLEVNEDPKSDILRRPGPPHPLDHVQKGHGRGVTSPETILTWNDHPLSVQEAHQSGPQHPLKDLREHRQD